MKQIIIFSILPLILSGLCFLVASIFALSEESGLNPNQSPLSRNLIFLFQQFRILCLSCYQSLQFLLAMMLLKSFAYFLVYFSHKKNSANLMPKTQEKNNQLVMEMFIPQKSALMTSLKSIIMCITYIIAFYFFISVNLAHFLQDNSKSSEIASQSFPQEPEEATVLQLSNYQSPQLIKTR